MAESVALVTGGSSGIGLAAARALIKHADLDAEAVAKEALAIAGEICIYTNGEIVVETL